MNAIKKIVMGLAVASAAVFCSAADIYVATTGHDDTGDGTQGNPYATIATGIAAAKAAGGGTVNVDAGTYTEYGLVLDAAIEVVGTGATRDDVIVNANKKGRAFTLSADGAALRNLTVQNGQISSGSGANVNLSGGVISNCVIKDGKVSISNGQGGNVYMTGGVIEDSEIVGGSGNGTNTSAGYSVYATGGRICRCKILNAVYQKMSSIAVDLEGAAVLENSLISGCNAGASGSSPYILKVNNASAKVVNCTVVDNVTAKFGVYVANGTVVNTVIYNNGGTKEMEWGNNNAAKFVNCAFAANASYSGSASTVKNLTNDDFIDALSGDYHLSASSACKDAGSDASYPADCSETDLDGNPRKSPAGNPIIDIGCYEIDQSKVSITGVAASDYVHFGSALDFTATAVGGEGSYTYKWDFGDGNVVETDNAVIGHTYAAPGLYEVSVTAKAGAGDYVTPYVLPVNTCVARQNLYVDSNDGDDAGDGTSESPFKTLGKAFSCLVNNVSGGATVADGVTIHIVSGSTCEECGFQIGSVVTVQGEGATRDDVIIDAKSKGYVFKLSAAGAALRNLTIQKGQISSGTGANVSMTADGVISNCVIKNGKVAANINNVGGNLYLTAGTVEDSEIVGGEGNGGNSCYGYDITMSGGRITRCTIRNAAYTVKSSTALDLTDTAIVENTLITGCKGGTEAKGRTITLNGANAKIINCTIIGNTAGGQGTVLADAGTVVNTVIYNNGGTAVKEWGNTNPKKFINCAFAKDLAPATGPACIDTVTDDAFKGYAAGDYMPAAGSVLLKAGTTWEDYHDTYGATSPTDLIGTPWGKTLDIGCYAAKAAGLMLILR